MAIKKTIGGDRLGSGKKMKVHLKEYERSTHNKSYPFRTTMAAGTLVPFLVETITPGSTMEIDLDAFSNTHPTVGPLFGSYKLQLDVFLVPIRLYNAQLHNNESGLGLAMEKVQFPQLLVQGYWDATKVNDPDIDNMQTSPSSLLAYLGIRGVGRSTTTGRVQRNFNAMPLMAYYEIYKNYYCNQQEEIGYIVSRGISAESSLAQAKNLNETAVTVPKSLQSSSVITIVSGGWLIIQIDDTETPIVTGEYSVYTNALGEKANINDLFNSVTVGLQDDVMEIYCSEPRGQFSIFGYSQDMNVSGEPILKSFPIKNIDQMKRNVFIQPYTTPLIIDSGKQSPYADNVLYDEDYNTAFAQFDQQGLAIKTYQNDLFNNWMNTAWIDGSTGINAISAVQVVDNKIQIPALILARKIFNVLNRIALSGGTYDDYIEVTYDHNRARRYESPAYMGGLIREIGFEEVVSMSATEFDTVQQPLGTLGGRGVMTDKKKGGQVTVKTDEPAMVIGIMSITPRIDYSQGNNWQMNLKNMNELHKPELDGIGFQDLITDQMAWWDTVTNGSGQVTYKSAGKQPAWINYMTNVPVVRGNFAKQEMMWMTLNRRYEASATGIKDLTSYIDPVKFNHVFADARLDAQNFWINAKVGITYRAKMSAKVMPNL